MDTEELLIKSGKKLEEALADFENDKKQLETLKKERGDLVAIERIETKPEQKGKIKKLEKAIEDLKGVIEDSPAVLEGLRKAQLSLQAKAKEEIIEKAEKEQAKIEAAINETSSKLLAELKEVQVQNSKLKDEWAEWEKLNKITGKVWGKRSVHPSFGMLDLICQTLSKEWNGGSSAEMRKFYSMQHFKNNHVVF